MKITKIKSTNRIEGFGTIAVLEIMSDEKVAVSGAPWGAPNTVTINYDVTE